MRYRIVDEPLAEPVTLDDAKAHLRVDGSEENALISGLIKAAREYCEGYTRRALAVKTAELYLDRFPPGDIELPLPPLVSVDGIRMLLHDGSELLLAQGEDYLVDTESRIGRIVLHSGKSWPSFRAFPLNPIKIRYTAGYVKLPHRIKQAMLLHIGFFYHNRDCAEIGEETDRAIKRLLSAYCVRLVV